MRAGFRLHQLRVDADAVAASPHRAFENVAHTELALDLLHTVGWPLYEKLELRALTKSQRMRDSAVMISATIPSAKYSCSGSTLRLAKGSTAIDGLSEVGKAAANEAPSSFSAPGPSSRSPEIEAD